MFGSEKRLVRMLESSILKSRSNIIKEFDSSNGIADIITFELRSDWKKNISLGKVPPSWAYALSQLPYRKKISPDAFAKEAGVTRKSALIYLNRFEKAGYCKKNEKTGSWVKIKQPRPIVKKIYAFEAKLRDWNRALSQACRYLEYSHQSWVVIDDINIKSAIANISKFKLYNIGLVSLRSDGVIIKHFVPAQLNLPKSHLRFWYANSKIAKALSED